MKMQFFLLAVLSLICFGKAALLGAKECTYGPAYWCSSIVKAKSCNAVPHCIQTVWEKEILPEDNDDVCGICKDMVKEARDQLLSNETQNEIRQVFEGSCKLIPITLIQDECIKLSDDFIPELIDTLASQMNPQVVCATAGLCNSIRVDKLLEQYYQTNGITTIRGKKDGPRDCPDCTNFVNDIVKKVHALPRSEVLHKILSICGRLGSLSDGCMSLVQTNFPFIYDFLTNGLHPTDVCDVIGFCPRLYGHVVITVPRTEDEPCDFCVAVVNSWRNNFLSNTTKEEFKMILDGICMHTGNFKAECTALVDQYFEILYDILVSEIQAKEICSAVGLCGVNSLFNNDPVPIWTSISMKPENHLVLDHLNSLKFTGRDEANSYSSNTIQLPKVTLTKSKVGIVNLGKKGVLVDDTKSHVKKSNQCVMCEFALHFLQNILSDKETRAEIEADVEKVCTLFPRELQEQCQDYIDAYGDQVIQMLVLEIDPSQICPMIHMCPGVSMMESMNVDTTCVLCQYVMTELDQILGDKSNEAQVKAAVESVCKFMPKSIRPECKSFIDMYVEQIVDLLINDFTPRQVCTQLGLCPQRKISQAVLPLDESIVILPAADTAKPIVTPKFKLEQSAGCIICEFIVSKIDSLLVTNSSEEEIRDAVDKVCLLLPSSLSNDCLGFMEEYSNAIIELLVNQLDPVLTCKKIKLCKSDTFIKGMWTTEATTTTIRPDYKCIACEDVIDFIAKQLSHGKVINDIIIAAIDELCKILPSKNRDQCEFIIDKYGVFLAKMIEELGDSKLVCQGMKMCPTTTTKPLLGAKKCTWGPGYWCQSQLHADACKATAHCTDKVWKGVVPKF